MHILVAMVAVLAARWAAAQCLLVPPQQHPWVRFPVGSWKTVRVTTETLSDGNVVGTSTSRTKTVLVRTDPTSYTLRVETIVDVGGRQLAEEPRIVNKPYQLDEKDVSGKLQKVGEGWVVVNGRRIPSQISRLIETDRRTRRITTVHYSDQVAPYILRRQTETTDGQVKYRSSVDVLAVQMPHRILSSMVTASWIKSVHERPDGTTIVVEVYSPEVPGGVVAHTTKQLDPTGNVVSRSTLELVDYGVPRRQRGGLVRRWLDGLAASCHHQPGRP